MVINRTDRGMTLVELLMALAISGVLMAAIAVAFNASGMNYTENYQLQQAVSKARQAMARITTQLRTAEDVDPTAGPNQCSLKTADGNDLTYEYRSDVGALYLVQDGGGSEYLLCDGLEEVIFCKTATEEANDTLLVTISMTVRCGSGRKSFSSATAIRRNLD